VRREHPERGRISPADFIPLAEDTGLIVPRGAWSLSTACEQNQRWRALGFKPIRMAVTLSSVQFRQPKLYESLTAVLAASRLDPRWLELELTESLLMHDAEAAIRLLERLKQLGVHLSIDDFGTGYSSLSYLKRFPIDALKIDQSFIREMTTSSADSALVTAIILMGRSMKLRVVAEGVETKSQLSFLRILQCDEIQGYLFSRPVPAGEIEQMLSGRVPAAFAA
jgi:EAL domain-containing protein (putative c-di-GMP-specific phosphodiesterase class I)